MINKGISANIESLLHEISGRATRATGRGPRVPLEPAANAAIPDTTDLTIDAAVAFVLERYRRTAPKAGSTTPRQAGGPSRFFCKGSFRAR
ncbi:MAG: hypothetical protein IPG84_04905 [Betaproteobacteria bacterium]|nr:hypothetical protein [Betaproteobacteria bacterium]